MRRVRPEPGVRASRAVAPEGVLTSSEARVEVRGQLLCRFHYLSGPNYRQPPTKSSW